MAAPPVLSKRQAEVYRLAKRGHTYVEIGAQLGISPRTVEHHAERVCAKLGVPTIRAALRARVRAASPRARRTPYVERPH